MVAQQVVVLLVRVQIPYTSQRWQKPRLTTRFLRLYNADSRLENIFGPAVDRDDDTGNIWELLKSVCNLGPDCRHPARAAGALIEDMIKIRVRGVAADTN